jgi:hypothetical protein
MAARKGAEMNDTDLIAAVDEARLKFQRLRRERDEAQAHRDNLMEERRVLCQDVDRLRVIAVRERETRVEIARLRRERDRYRDALRVIERGVEIDYAEALLEWARGVAIMALRPQEGGEG